MWCYISSPRKTWNSTEESILIDIIIWWRRKWWYLLKWSFCCWLTVASRSICSAECTYDGCWGPGDAQCLACQNYRHGNRCLPSCDVETGLYVDANGNRSVGGPKQCGRCHEECLGSCRNEVSYIIIIIVIIIIILWWKTVFPFTYLIFVCPSIRVVVKQSVSGLV